MKRLLTVGILSLMIIIISANAVSAQKKVRVRFAKGAYAETYNDRIYGYDYVDYVVGAKAEQEIYLKLESANEFAQFIVFDPDMDNLEGSGGDTYYVHKLPSNGDYTVRVLLPRSEARRRGAVADYSIWIGVQ